MSRHAIAYVNSLGVTDATVRTVLQLLAERTHAPGDHRRPDDVPDIMGLHLQDSDVPTLALRAGLDPDKFRQQVRALKQHVKMDVLEHSDGLWEIVYGPSYTRPPKPRSAEPDLTRGGPHPFWLPGWEKYSTWGYEQDPSGHQHLYAS